MTRWQSITEAASLVRSGNRVYIGTACAAPHMLVAAIEARTDLHDVEFVSFVTTAANEGLQQRPPTRHRYRVFFVGSDVAGLDSRQLDYVPISLEDVPSLLSSWRLPIDVALLQVSPPDGRGYVSLGISVDLAPAVLDVARLVIGAVNPAMPRSQGESFVHLDRFDALVQVDTPLAEYVHDSVGAAGAQVARYLASLIEDGATLQVGLGRMPNEALRHLTDRRDLGIHSDVITDGILELMEAGVITGRHKRHQPGRVVTSYALGTRRLYDAIDGNPAFALLPIQDVCDPAIIARNPKVVSVTQAFTVDLTGQACVDQYEGALYGGISTQAAFSRGAARSPGGKPVICVASLAGDGVTSRIKSTLEAGAAAGITRSDVHYVITEWGIAYLFGKSLRERAIAMIEIAHPMHRDTLLSEAKVRGLVTQDQYVASRVAYPVDEERTVTLKAGKIVLLRPSRATDAAGMQLLFHSMTDDDRYTRFFRRVKSLPFKDLQALCNVDHTMNVAFVAVTGPRESEQVIGSACYFVNPSSNLAEIAFMVAPEWQGTGVGSALQTRLGEYGRSQGLRGFTAEMLLGNRRMMSLALRARGSMTTTADGNEVSATILFDDT